MSTPNLFSPGQCEEYLRQLEQAWLAVAWQGRPQLMAVPFTWTPGNSTLRLPRCLGEHLPKDGCFAAVGADEGHWFFDLRGVHLKGTLTFAAYDGEHAVYRFAEDRVRGWDYRGFAAETINLGGADAALTRARKRPEGIIRIASLSKGGRPHLTPIWYSRSGARYVISTAGSAILVRNMRHQPMLAAAITHADGDGFYSCTYILGRAQFEPQGLRTLPGIISTQARYMLPRRGIANMWRYRSGLKSVSAYFKTRTDPGCVILDADTTVHLASAEGLAGEWLSLSEAATTS